MAQGNVRAFRPNTGSESEKITIISATSTWATSICSYRTASTQIGLTSSAPPSAKVRSSGSGVLGPNAVRCMCLIPVVPRLYQVAGKTPTYREAKLRGDYGQSRTSEPRETGRRGKSSGSEIGGLGLE